MFFLFITLKFLIMSQLRFDWYDNVPSDFKTMFNLTFKDDEKQEKQQSQKQAKEQQAKRQASLRKSKSRRYQALRADEVAHNFMKSIRL